MFEHTFTRCCCFLLFFYEPFLGQNYVKPDLLIKLFEIEIELSGHITVLGAIALTVSF